MPHDLDRGEPAQALEELLNQVQLLEPVFQLRSLQRGEPKAASGVGTQLRSPAKSQVISCSSWVKVQLLAEVHLEAHPTPHLPKAGPFHAAQENSAEEQNIFNTLHALALPSEDVWAGYQLVPTLALL